MTDLEAEKALAARRAIDEVETGMLVGLGTGSTMAYAIRELGARVAKGLRIKAVATSSTSEALARSLGIELLPGPDVASVDLAIDGADEIDPALNAIKGGGGALLREKVVAASADRMIVIVDSSKPVERLGRFKLPLEVLPFASAWVTRSLKELGVDVGPRMRDGAPYLTDQGNYIFDAPFNTIDDPASLAAALDRIPGIVEHGLFLTEIDLAMIGRGDQVEIRRRKPNTGEVAMRKRDLPFQPIRSRLYTSSELSAGFDPTRPDSMAEMADFLTYRYFKVNGRATPVDEFVGMMEALHDNSILQAMFAFLTDRPRIAAIMGGHREIRGSTNYRRVAQLANKLSKKGFLLASGGGPGAMEATHLGALLQNHDQAALDQAVDALTVEVELPPNAQNVVDSFGRVDMDIVKALHKWSAPAHALMGQVKNPGESLAVPTWHYGHEPVTPLASHAAKYFLNSIREDVLLYLASQGIIFAPGRAGTLQEVFQDAAQNYYPDEGKFFSPMIFFDADGFWTNKLPVKPLLESLFKLGGPEREEQFRHNVLFTDDIDRIVTFLEERAPSFEQIKMRIAQLGMNQMFQAAKH